MFAVIKTGGKQYKVAANDVLKIEKLDHQAGDVVTFDQVLMVGDGDVVTVGAPLVEGALVAGHLIETKKQKTIIVFKKERRHNYRRRNGHRQLLTSVRITEILTGGAKPTTKPDEALKAKYLAKLAANGVVSVTEAPAAKPVAKAAPKKAAPKVEVETPAEEAPKKAPAKAKAAAKPAAEKPAKAAKAEKPAVEKTAKPAAKKAAPKADKE
jgi:large subunit ribosomal protein L21